MNVKGWHACGYTECREKVLGRRKYCSANCRAYAHRDGQTQKATKAKPDACDGCSFNRPCAASERGKECIAGLYRTCAPWTGYPTQKQVAS